MFYHEHGRARQGTSVNHHRWVPCRMALAIMDRHFSWSHAQPARLFALYLCRLVERLSRIFSLCLPLLFFPVLTKCSFPFRLMQCPKNFAWLFRMLLSSVLLESAFSRTSSFYITVISFYKVCWQYTSLSDASPYLFILPDFIFYSNGCGFIPVQVVMIIRSFPFICMVSSIFLSSFRISNVLCCKWSRNIDPVALWLTFLLSFSGHTFSTAIDVPCLLHCNPHCLLLYLVWSCFQLSTELFSVEFLICGS